MGRGRGNLASFCKNSPASISDFLGLIAPGYDGAYTVVNIQNRNFQNNAKREEWPKDQCVIPVCCRPVLTLLRAHCVIRFYSGKGKIRGCRGGPTGVGSSSGSGGSSGSSGSGSGNGQDPHCKGCCGAWGNVVAGCGSKSESTGSPAFRKGLDEDLDDANNNPDRCQTAAILTNSEYGSIYDCIKNEMERITGECYKYDPLGNNSNTSWETAYKKCMGTSFEPPGSQPGNTTFNEEEKCKDSGERRRAAAHARLFGERCREKHPRSSGCEFQLYSQPYVRVP